jgi:glutaredoxin
MAERAGGTRGLWIVAAIALVYYGLVALHRSGFTEEDLSAKLAPDNSVVMYSLTSCPYCGTLRGRLTHAGIPFTEYFIDIDETRSRQFTELLVTRGLSPSVAGTPTLMVNGALLLNNPSMDEIKRRLRYRG